MRRPTPPDPDPELDAALGPVRAAVVHLGWALYGSTDGMRTNPEWPGPAWDPRRVERVRLAAEALPADERDQVWGALERAGAAVAAGRPDDLDEAVHVMFDLGAWLDDLTTG